MTRARQLVNIKILKKKGKTRASHLSDDFKGKIVEPQPQGKLVHISKLNLC